MSRADHTFQFKASQICAAANTEASYHEERLKYWESEYEKSVVRVKETAGIKFEEQEMTGGKRLSVALDFGDDNAYRRLHTSYNKIDWHRAMAEKLRTDAVVYGTQGDRVYELSTDDVHYYRLGGGSREE